MAEHTHHESEEISEALKGINSYWKIEPVFEFSAEIKEIEKSWMRLSENHFYPEGGGQLSDVGHLVVGEKAYNVVDVQIKEKETWIKTSEKKLPQIGIKVKAIIDKTRRYKLSRNHSSQHLLSAVFWEVFENDTARAEINVEENVLELEKKLEFKDVIQAMHEVNRLISENLTIKSTFYTDFSSLPASMRGEMADDYELYRVVEIGDYDYNLCGGTHVSSTTEIGAVFFNKIEGKKLRFISGLSAHNMLMNSSLTLQRISKNMGKNMSEVETSILEMKEKYNLSLRTLRQTRIELLSSQLTSTDPIAVGDYSIKLLYTKELQKGKILEAVKDLGAADGVLILQDSGLLVVKGLTSEISGSIMNSLKNQGIKGGGKGEVLLGKTDYNLIKLQEILQNINS